MSNRKDYNNDDELRALISSFRNAVSSNDDHFFDDTELEMVIDYYLDHNDLDHVEEALLYAESFYPDYTGIRLRRVHLLCARGQYDLAMPLLRDLVRLEPDNCDVHYALGAVYSALGDHQASIHHYLQAAKDNYALDAIYSEVGHEYVILDRIDQAIQYFKKAAAVSPHDSLIISNLVDCYIDAEMVTNGITFFQKFIDQYPDNEYIWAALGELHYANQQYEEAIDAYEFALAIDKTNVTFYSHIADCYMMQNDPANASSILLESLKYSNSPESIYNAVGNCYLHSHNYNAAMPYYRKAINEDPYNAEALNGLALCSSYLNDNANAITYIERAIEVAPMGEYFRNAIFIYIYDHNYEKALEYVVKAIDVGGDDDSLWIQFATHEYYDGLYQHILSYIDDQRSLASDPAPFDIIAAACHFKLGHISTCRSLVAAGSVLDDKWMDNFLKLCPEAEPFVR